MSSSPTIKYILATKATDILFLALVENTGSRGLVRLKTYNKSTGTCVEDSAMQNDWCIEVTTNPYISEIWALLNTYKSSGTLFSKGCLRAFVCNSGENCDTLSCGYWNTSPNSINDNVDVGGSLGVIPSAIGNYKLTPGDKSITASWTAPGNTPIFAYAVKVIRVVDGKVLIGGGVEFPMHVARTNVFIGNLENGKEYSISVRPVSDDGYNGPWSTLNAIPTITCPIPAVALTIPT